MTSAEFAACDDSTASTASTARQKFSLVRALSCRGCSTAVVVSPFSPLCAGQFLKARGKEAS